MTTLKHTLRAMLADARAHTGLPIRRSLPRGLVLDVLQAADGTVQLTIARYDQAPSDAEWTIVLKHWPEPVVPGVIPTPRREGRRHALVGRWARPAMLVEPE
ncbi:MAG: hypothetical protein IT318_23955 [Anaerolineales bacterium]|nr:hypothetical protein [Anaerolineales bacterium]